VSELRFCFLTTFYPPYHFGGDAIGIQRFARGLVRHGHHVTVVHDVDAFEALAPGRTPPPGEDDGVEIVPLKSGIGIVSPLLTQQFGRPIANGRRIKALLARGDYDVVNFHNVSLVGGPGLLSYAGKSISMYMAHEHWLVCPMHVLWRHGRERCDGRECLRCSLHYKRPPQLWRYTGYLERQVRQLDVVIAMSQFSRAKHREFGFPRDMEVLPYFLPDPAPAARFAPVPAGDRPQEKPYFFFAGRLERIKGLDDVIPAFRDFADADLLIAGDGEHGDALRAQAQGMPNVRFIGRISPDELRRYYQHAVALVVPSECFETFGIVLIEAFAQGTPVIARRLGPFPEILADSEAGELFDTRDDLLAAMRKLQGDPAYRARLAANGYRAYVDRWSESAVIPRYLDIVRRAATRRGHTRVIAALSAQEVA
jgi:glycosyltransferase involved in cell wall biosynthesis